MKKLLAKISLCGIICSFLVFSSCGEEQAQDVVTFDTSMGYVQFTVDIVKSVEDQKAGLSGVEHLPQNKGMLFWYDEASVLHFWMKDMKIPIDIVFIGPDMKVSHILKELEPCVDIDRCPSYSSMRPALYVVEINSGLADKHGIRVGSEVEIAHK